MPFPRRTTCAMLGALLACPAGAVTGARVIVDDIATHGNTTYIASVNDTDQEIVHLGTDYADMHDDPDIRIRSIPAHYSPSRGMETDYTAAHPALKAAGLGFDHSFPNGVSGGYRYQIRCSQAGRASLCHIARDAHALTHYRTTCNGKPLSFTVSATWGKDPGALLSGSIAALGTTLVGPLLLDMLPWAYQLACTWWIGTFHPEATTLAQIEALAQQNWWLSNPANTAARAALMRAGPLVGALAFVTYFEIESSLAPHGALFSEDSYVNVAAEGSSQLTAKLVDSPIEQHVIIDDCLEVDAIAQDVPYVHREDAPRLVPDANDALISMVYRRKLPAISAAQSCALRVDDSLHHFDGYCTTTAHQMIPASLDASDCANATDIVNDNGVLRCVGERIARPRGSYLDWCRTIRWNGSVLGATCGPFDFPGFPSLDYGTRCAPDSTVSYSFDSRSLRCDRPRPGRSRHASRGLREGARAAGRRAVP